MIIFGVIPIVRKPGEGTGSLNSNACILHMKKTHIFNRVFFKKLEDTGYIDGLYEGL